MRASRRHFTVTAVALCGTVAALALAPASASAATYTATGTIVAVNPQDFIIKTAGSNGGRLNQMISYADKLEAKNYPYVYGGGHGKVGVASGGRNKGFDCSGVVAAVLEAGGLWPKNTSVPGDAGIIQQLLQRKLIASGPASGPYQLALFDDPGKDIQEKIGGRFYGTGVGRRGGAGWLDDSVVEFRGYKQYHVLPSVLHERRSYGDYLTFSFAGGSSQEAIANEVTVGANVQVSYAEAGDSAITAKSVKNIGGKPFRS